MIYFRIQSLADDINKSNNELTNILRTIEQMKNKKTFVILLIIYSNKILISFLDYILNENIYSNKNNKQIIYR